VPSGGVNGVALGAIAAGGVFAYAGIKGYSVPRTIQDLITGKNPSGQSQANPIGTPVQTSAAASPGAAGTTDSAVANDALRYAGHPYIYGGAPGTNGTSGWDCSSFCNWVLGHDLGMTLPGDSSPGYNGENHGPTTLSYLGWTAAQTIGHSADTAMAGDLCVWQTHMGIATGGGQMISALNESLGTRVTTVSGGAPPGEFLFVRRINAAYGTAESAGASAAGAAGD
jgi:cell wall-associated NlpC family hydrolase